MKLSSAATGFSRYLIVHLYPWYTVTAIQKYQMPFLSIWYEQDFKADTNFLIFSCLHGYGLDPTKNLKYAVVIGGVTQLLAV